MSVDGHTVAMFVGFAALGAYIAAIARGVGRIEEAVGNLKEQVSKLEARGQKTSEKVAAINGGLRVRTHSSPGLEDE